MILQLSQIKKSFGAKVIFDDLQFEIKGNEKIALVGRNGAGKTTLLNMIANNEPIDSGNIFRHGKITVGYLKQMAFKDETISVKQAFEAVFEEVRELERKITLINDQLQQIPTDEALLNQLAQYQHQFEYLDGYTIEANMKSLLTSFGFQLSDLDKPLNEFSGGQKTRLGFVQMLLQKPDVLLLDEPTNHLDIETIEWLEGYLRQYPKAIVLTSHDRLFLDRVCNTVVELEHGKAIRFTGNYSSYVDQKQLMLQKQAQLYEYQQKDIARLEALIEKFRYKKSKAAFAKSKEKYLQRMERIEKVSTSDASFRAIFQSDIRGGKEVLVMNKAVIGYDEPLFETSFTLRRGERMAILGPNGCGKSSLLKSVVGQLELLSGEMMLGHQIKIGYFRQDLHQFDQSKTVLEEVWDRFPKLDRTQIRTALAQFLFKADDVFKEISVLSGGEKVRLSLLILLMERANFLIMDEPTNHLDIESKQALEAALKEYSGTLLFVSHDRYFISQLATCVLKIDQGMSVFDELDVARAIEKPLEVQKTADKKEVNLDYQQSLDKRKLRKQLEKLELELAKNQEILENMREMRYDPEYYHDYQKMTALNLDIDDAVNVVANLEKEWVEIASLLEKYDQE